MVQVVDLEGLGQQNPIFLQSYFCRGSNQLDFLCVSCVGHDKSGLLVISAMLGIAEYGSRATVQPCWDCFTGSTLPAYRFCLLLLFMTCTNRIDIVTIFFETGRCLKSENMRILRWSHMNYIPHTI